MTDIEILSLSDMSMTYTSWQSKNKIIILPPLHVFNTKLSGLQLVNSKLRRIDFELIEKDDKIIFHDLNTFAKYILDIAKVSNGQLQFIGNLERREIWSWLDLDVETDLFSRGNNE